MPLARTKEILLRAYQDGYAVGAFNFVNMEVLQAIVKAADQLKAPVIIQVTEGALEYAGLKVLAAMARIFANESAAQVALHLDHGHQIEVIRACIEEGFGSVMIDASHLPFEENVRLTKSVVDIAHAAGVAVEAELGRLMGVEDTVSVTERDAVLVNPELAAEFVRETHVDFLAPAVGTSHGAFKFKGEAHIDFERLRRVKELTGIPLVLHGASSIPPALLKEALDAGILIPEAKGVPAEEIRKAMELGIAKVNVDTDLRIGFVAALRQTLGSNPTLFDVRKLLGPAREKVARIVSQRIKELGSAGRI